MCTVLHNTCRSWHKKSPQSGRKWSRKIFVEPFLFMRCFLKKVDQGKLNYWEQFSMCNAAVTIFGSKHSSIIGSSIQIFKHFSKRLTFRRLAWSFASGKTIAASKNQWKFEANLIGWKYCSFLKLFETLCRILTKFALITFAQYCNIHMHCSLKGKKDTSFNQDTTPHEECAWILM